MTNEEQKKAIKILQWLHDNDFLFRSTEEDVKYATKLGIQALEQTRWIPVSEKLPEDGIYLVTAERTPGVPRIETKSFAKDLHRVDDYDFPEHKCGWYDYDSEYGYWEDTDVIAWMPLPEPYKAETEQVGNPDRLEEGE